MRLADWLSQKDDSRRERFRDIFSLKVLFEFLYATKKGNQLNYSYDKVEGELGGRGELGEEG